MATIGSINDRLFYDAMLIAKGRKFLHTPKIEPIGRITFHTGIRQATKAFKDASATNDIKTIIQAQLTFVKQDLAFCDSGNKYAAKSFQASVTDLQDSLNSLTILEIKGLYPAADKTYSTRREADRTENLPKDVVHKTLNSEVARMRNSLASNAVSPIEREFTQQRIENMKHAQELYKQLQREVLGIAPVSKSRGSKGGGGRELGD
jgi:hypothetical protein